MFEVDFLFDFHYLYVFIIFVILGSIPTRLMESKIGEGINMTSFHDEKLQ